MKTKSVRKEEAVERQVEHDKLTIQEKIAKLDNKFGKGVGAKKERAQLQMKLEKKKEK